MPCYRPIDAWPAAPPNRGVVFSPMQSYAGAKAISLPCGRCIGCRMGRSREWATRLHHEASQHQANSFLTLTYSDEHLPADYSVRPREMQLFMKRLRKSVEYPIRFFACGEYGGRTQRPHYHVIVFGHDFHEDRFPWIKSNTGELLYRSHALEKVWTFGHALIGSVTFQSAGYVARYMLKKVGGDAADEHYTRTHPITGEVCRVGPEFITMSTRPGIGRGWYDKYSGDAFPSDFLIVDGRKVPVPEYYAKLLEQRDSRQHLAIKSGRKLTAAGRQEDETLWRLDTREQVQALKVQRLHRKLEDSDT